MRLRNLCIALLFLLPAAASAQTADEILAKIIAARAAATNSAPSVPSASLNNFLRDVSGPFVVDSNARSKCTCSLNRSKQTMVRVYDGHPAGQQSVAGKLNPEPMRKTIEKHHEESDFDGPCWITKAKQSGRFAARTRLTTKILARQADQQECDGASTCLRRSFLLLKWEGKRSTRARTPRRRFLFTDYRDVAGLKSPSASIRQLRNRRKSEN